MLPYSGIASRILLGINGNNRMHEKSVEKVKSIIKKALKRCYVEDNWPQYLSYNNELQELSKKILKNKDKKEWLNESDVYGIFTSQVANFINDEFPKEKITGKITDLLSNQKLKE